MMTRWRKHNKRYCMQCSAVLTQCLSLMFILVSSSASRCRRHPSWYYCLLFCDSLCLVWIHSINVHTLIFFIFLFYITWTRLYKKKRRAKMVIRCARKKNCLRKKNVRDLFSLDFFLCVHLIKRYDKRSRTITFSLYILCVSFYSLFFIYLFFFILYTIGRFKAVFFVVILFLLSNLRWCCILD